MNGRKLYREYAQYLGREATEFVEIKKESYSPDTLITKNSNRELESTTINYEEVVNLLIKGKING